MTYLIIYTCKFLEKLECQTWHFGVAVISYPACMHTYADVFKCIYMYICNICMSVCADICQCFSVCVVTFGTLYHFSRNSSQLYIMSVRLLDIIYNE